MPEISIKKPSEIEGMRRSCQTVRAILEEVRDAITPGMTTKEADLLAAEAMKRHAVKSAFLGYRGFPGHICISINEEVVHGIGGGRRIQYGDLVKLDIGIIQDGWVGDTATTVAVGEVKPKIQRLLQDTEAALMRGIDQARSGNRVRDISAAIEDYATQRGYSVVREFVGHGVGRKLHEEPQIPNYVSTGGNEKLKAGMTLAIEPMVNVGEDGVRILDDGWTVVTADGQPSAHFEHTILVTENEPEILTCLSPNLTTPRPR